MQTNWDYSGLARSYISRPQYSSDLVAAIFKIASAGPGSLVCDVGAGVGHLTRHHVENGHKTVAVEPNDDMRTVGQELLEESESLAWVEGTGEATNQKDSQFELVTFGSSFNVCDRPLALVEASRILRPEGWFVCLWNHRDLEDPLQLSIEKAIADLVPGYSYGSRREDQSQVIRESRLFSEPLALSGRIDHKVSYDEVLTAWKSHATLKRQAGPEFGEVIRSIEDILNAHKKQSIETDLLVPYKTVAWMAKSRRN
jgi:SAM-dependent methyltransferase